MNISDLNVSAHPSFDHHQQVKFFDDPVTGLKAIIAVHNTNLGPSFGGCRFYPYAKMDDAVSDVLRLSRGMTYKSALAGLPLGGGKSVIIGNPKIDKTPEKMKAFGRAIQSMNGVYITAEDVGTTENDMVAIHQETPYVSGLPHTDDENSLHGNPSPITAYGVVCGMRAAAENVFGHKDFSRLTVAIQGLGAVGYGVAEILAKDGAKLIVADLDQSRCELLKSKYLDQVTIVSGDEILSMPADILCPCAMGAVLNDLTIPRIKTPVVAGAANNQLAFTRHDRALHDRGVLYAPDYAINSGGIIAVAYQFFQQQKLHNNFLNLTQAGIMEQVEKIEATTYNIFSRASDEKIPTGQAADKTAKEIFES